MRSLDLLRHARRKLVEACRDGIEPIRRTIRVRQTACEIAQFTQPLLDQKPGRPLVRQGVNRPEEMEARPGRPAGVRWAGRQPRDQLTERFISTNIASIATSISVCSSSSDSSVCAKNRASESNSTS